MKVFENSSTLRFLNLKNWIINLDVWGSYLPLSVHCYDIQLTRTAAYVGDSFLTNSID